MAKDSNVQAFMVDFLLGGVSGAVSKTLTAPIERVKLVVQTQDANPKIRSGEVPRYTGMVDCAQRILKEQGLYRFWDGNFTNCLRYFPTQAFNLAFKDTFKKMFPKYNPKTEFWKFFGANLVSGGLAAAASMTIVYPLDYARTRLASDVGSGKATFSGLGDCIMKTAKGPGGFFALYTGFGVSVCGIIGYRGLQLGTFDTITGLNPWKKDPGFLGALTTFGAAQTAITIGAGATYPFDTVRRRLQMQSEKPVEEHIYKGTVDCFKKIAAEEGQPLRNFCLPDSLPTLATVVILADSSELLMLRKPASWIVAVCEQSEYKGVWGRACPSGPKSRYYLGGRVCFGSVFPGHVPCGKRVTVGYRFPLGPHFGEPFGVLGRGADVCEKGEGGLAQIGKVRVKAPFATAVDVGGGRTKVARLEGLCRAL